MIQGSGPEVVLRIPGRGKREQDPDLCLQKGSDDPRIRPRGTCAQGKRDKTLTYQKEKKGVVFLFGDFLRATTRILFGDANPWGFRDSEERNGKPDVALHYFISQLKEELHRQLKEELNRQLQGRGAERMARRRCAVRLNKPKQSQRLRNAHKEAISPLGVALACDRHTRRRQDNQWLRKNGNQRPHGNT